MWLRSLTKQQILIAAGVLLVSVLALVSFLVSPEIPYYQVKPQQSQAEFNAKLLQDRKAYEEYLQKLNINYDASRELLQAVVTKEDVAKLVDAELDTSQPVTIPEVANSEIRILRSSGKTAIQQYADSMANSNSDLTGRTKVVVEQMFSASPEVLTELQGQIERHVARVLAVPVPEDAVALHKSYINVYRSMARQVAFVSDFVKSGGATPFSKWYPEAGITLDQSAKIYDEGVRLEDEYGVAFVNPRGNGLGSAGQMLVSLGLVKQASAFFGEAFLVELAKDAVSRVVTAAYNKLMSSLIALIEKNYIIANFLQYGDALVAAKYSKDYLDKYVGDPIDKQMIKAFIPQFACGAIDAIQTKQLANLRAREFLGFDPLALDPNDPNFTSNLLKLGNSLAFEDGQIGYAKASAIMTEFRAQAAASQEINSPGKKTAVGGEFADPNGAAVARLISKSVSLVGNAQLASLIGNITSGLPNFRSTNPLVITLNQVLVDGLFNNFVFSGADFVVKEQTRELCLKGAAAFGKLLPAAAVNAPAETPNIPSASQLRQCEYNPNLPQCNEEYYRD